MTSKQQSDSSASGSVAINDGRFDLKMCNSPHKTMCPVLLGVHCTEKQGGAFVLHIIVPKEAPSGWCIPKKNKKSLKSKEGKKIKN